MDATRLTHEVTSACALIALACAPPAIGDEPAVDRDAFVADVSCHVTCRAGAPQQLTRSALFSPAALGLKHADGGIRFAALTTHLEHFGERTCLSAALDACGTIDKIAEVRLDGLRSKDWSLRGRVTCSPAQPPVLSPYDPSFASGGLERERSAAAAGPLASTALGQFVSPKPVSLEELRKKNGAPLERAIVDRAHLEEARYVGATHCRVSVQVTSCFGDCMCDPDDGRGCTRESILLGSPRSNAQATTVICADPLVKELRAKLPATVAPDVIGIYCRDFAVRTLIHDASVTPTASCGTSCAAFRADYACGAVVEALAAGGAR